MAPDTTRIANGNSAPPRARFSASDRPIPPGLDTRPPPAPEHPADKPRDFARLRRIAIAVLAVAAAVALHAAGRRSPMILLAVILLAASRANSAVLPIGRRPR